SFTGLTAEESKGEGWLDQVLPAHVPRVKQALQQAMERKESIHIEYRLRAADGRYHSMLDSASPQSVADGTFIGYVGFCTDVGATRMTLPNMTVAALPQRRDFATSTDDHSPIGMWKLDQDLTITKTNEAAANQLGVSRES